MAEKIEAHVQYDDWVGSSAADGADHTTIQMYLSDKGYLPEGSFVVAVRAFLGGNHGTVDDTVSIRAIIADGVGFDDVNAQVSAQGILQFKEVNLELPVIEFFSLFKRFSIVLGSSGLNLHGREYEITEEIYPA